jgi:hypothetical protein
MKTAPRIVYANARRVGLAESSRMLLFHLLQQEYRGTDNAQASTRMIEDERNYLRERVGHKPGTAIILERMLSGLYEDARTQFCTQEGGIGHLPPQACPYTLESLLQASGRA